MQIIINFIDLKQGEIWLEMYQDVVNAEFELETSDAYALELLTRISRNKFSSVLDTQRYLIQRSNENVCIQNYVLTFVYLSKFFLHHFKLYRKRLKSVNFTK
jgi:hypothetical protein